MNCSFEKAREAALGVHEHVWNKGRPDVLDGDFAKFVFTEQPSLAVESFGFDLIKHGLFALPFQRTYFEWSGEGTWALFCWTESDRLVAWTAMNPDGKGWGCDMPVRIGLEGLGERLKNGGPLVAGNWPEDVKKAGESTIRECVACVATLAAKGIERDAVSVPDKVNAKRLKQGKRPLPSYTVIRLDKYRRANGNGTHASPRPHWRRGHVRELPSGAKTMVRPHVVMADPGALPEYKIR